MGVLLYALLCGFLPFDDDNTAVLYKLIQSGKYTIPERLSRSSASVIAGLLQVTFSFSCKFNSLIEHRIKQPLDNVHQYINVYLVLSRETQC